MDQNDLMILQTMLLVACNSNDFFTSHEMEEMMGQYVDLVIGVWDALVTM
jgi:hypothetical protein